MRELRPGAPLVNELGDTPYVHPAARNQQTFEQLRIARILEVCGYLPLGYLTEIELVEPDEPCELADWAGMIKGELARLREEQQPTTRPVEHEDPVAPHGDDAVRQRRPALPREAPRHQVADARGDSAS